MREAVQFVKIAATHLVPNMREEIWKSIYGGIYAVSSLGRIKRLLRSRTSLPGKIFPGTANLDGYLVVTLRKNNKKRIELIHRLVAGAFLGTCPSNKEVNHKDGNKKNNCIDNLEYITQLENITHAIKLGLVVKARGESQGTSKLTERQALQIKKLCQEKKFSQKKIAEMFNISKGAVEEIAQERNWAWLRV